MANPQAGIQELRYIDPLKMKYIRQEKKKGNKYDIGAVRVNGGPKQEVDHIKVQSLKSIFNILHHQTIQQQRWVEVQPSQSNLQKTL